MIAQRLIRGVLVMVLGGAAGFLAVTANAQTWTAGSNQKWNNTNNWLPKAIPNSATADVTFDNTTAASANTVTLNISPTVRSITVTNVNGPVSIVPSSTETITFGGSTTGSGIFMSSAAANLTISSNVAIANTAGTQSWVVASGRTLTLSGVLSGAGTTSSIVIGSAGNTGTVVLSGTGANTYARPISVNFGTLRIDKASGLGTTAGNTTIAAGATLSLNYTSGTSTEPLALSGNLLSTDSASTRTFGGPITLSGTAATVNAQSGNTLNITNLIGGSGEVEFNGDGTVVLSRSAGNTYSGDTTISSGTVLANNSSGGTSSATGSGTVLVTGTGTLAGTGQIVGDVIVGSGGTLRPGATPSSIDFDVVGNVTVNSGGRHYVNLSAPTTAVRLDVSGTGAGNWTFQPGAQMVVDGNNSVGLGAYTVQIGTVTGSLAHSFGSLSPNVSFVNFGLNYGNFLGLTQVGTGVFLNYSVTTVPIPEPMTAFAFGAFSLGLAALVRRRRG